MEHNKIDLLNVEEESTEVEVLKLSEIYWKDYLEEQNYNKNIHKMCEDCIAEQFEKFGRKTIPCSGTGLAEYQLGHSMFKEITQTSSQDEIDAIRAVYNSYDFMEAYCDVKNKNHEKRLFKGRWYQHFITACLHGDTLVTLGNNTTKKIKDIQINDLVYSYDEITDSFKVNKVTNVWNQGIKPVCSIKTTTGVSLYCTDDHLLYIGNGVYKSIKDGLTIGSFIYSFNSSVNSSEAIEIESISSLGEFETFDIEVENNHNFLANNIIVHNCTAKSKVIRMGRRCLPGYEAILQADGKTTPIKDIKIGSYVVSYRNGRITYNKVIDKWSNGTKPVYRIELSDGKTVDCTENHPLLVHPTLEWKSIEDGLTSGINVVTFNSNSFSQTTIKNITYLSDMETYDITIENDHNFIVNGIVTHNTGKTTTLAMEIIHKCMTDRGSKGTGHRALLVSPYQVQTDEVITTIKLLCNSFEVNPIVRSKASPAHMIEFNTGSILMGFTAGETGDSIRGQPADSIWLDECDDIPAKALTSLAGIFMDNPDVAVWKSGTPKGELNLYSAAQEQHTKEFHYPSFVIPHYNDQIDNQLRGEMDEIGYIQECLALYGASSNGIFQVPFINEACSKLNKVTLLDVLSNRSRYITIIGVDWNHDQVGTRIITIAYDKEDPQFYIIRKDRVALEGWTQQKAIDTIIKINRKVRADHIYVDAGFGTTQIGELRMFGESQKGLVDLDHPDLNLVDVQAVDFGSTIEVKDPTSQETFKQGMKQFVVQNAVQVLEKQLLTLDKEEDKDIISQMKNYVQKSRNKGRVVYGCVSKKIGDHDLDAFMIGLFGFKKEYSTTLKGLLELSGYKFATSVMTRNLSEDTITEVDPLVYDDFAISFSSKKQPLANRTASVLKYSTTLKSSATTKRRTI